MATPHTPLPVPNPSARDVLAPGHARRRRTASSAVVAAVLSVLLSFSTLASAAPVDPGDDELAAARSAQDVAAAEVDRVRRLVADAEAALQQVTVRAEAASDAALVAQAELLTAQQQAAATAAQLATARAAVEATAADVTAIGREAYMRGDTYGAEALLDADGPGELLERAALLEQLGDARSEQLDELEVQQAFQARADRAARAALADRNAAAGAAAEAEAEAEAQLAASQQAYDAATQQKADLERQLRDAQIALLTLQGVRDAAAAHDRQQAAARDAESAGAALAAAANAGAAATARQGGGAVAPTSGRLTSCYGARWGTTHFGVDIAAPIGTPIYAPEGGRVLQAGAASGFGLAVYLQHADGTITVYGHVDSFSVAVGQQVGAGEPIAEVGNKGQSTGPHLHFEVHTGGLYQNRVDPMPWLSSRGVSLGSGCS